MAEFFADHFARVLPIVGKALRDRRVALFGCAAGAQLAELLAASGLVRWAFAAEGPAALDSSLVQRYGPHYAGQAAHTALAAALYAHHGSLIPWQCVVLEPDTAISDLVISVDIHPAASAMASRLGCPLIRLTMPPAAGPETWSEGYLIRRLAPDSFSAEDPFAAAAFARALLLRDTPEARPDLEALPEHPPAAALQPLFRTSRNLPAFHERTAIVIGCGSLGSLIADELARIVRRLVLVDGGAVAAANPARQLYRESLVGQPKASALEAELRIRLGALTPELIALNRQVSDEEATSALIASYNPDLLVIATGSHVDFALARAARAANVPHLAVRCYPRARFWEAIVIADREQPCLGCLRGQLYLGSLPPPTPEELAAYAAPGELAAEPATLTESGWAAHCSAELAVQLLAPPGLRERWFMELTEAGQTCFIGGAYAVESAFGIERPGQVRAFGLEQIAGSAVERICADCGRRWTVRYRLD